MKLPKESRIEKATTLPKEYRKALENPYLDLTDKENPVMVATNGKIMAVVKVEVEETDTQGYVTADALKAERKVKYGNGIAVNGDQKLSDGRTFPRPTTADVGNFPDWRKALPTDKKPLFSVGLDTALLANLAAALGSENVTLEFYRGEIKKTKGEPRQYLNTIKVRGPQGYGAIMPRRV